MKGYYVIQYYRLYDIPKVLSKLFVITIFIYYHISMLNHRLIQNNLI
jgi:hypothetical protein